MCLAGDSGDDFFDNRPILISPAWRGGRAVECAGFEIQYGLRVIGGSNPPLSVRFKGIRNGVLDMTPFRPFWGVLRGLARLRDFTDPTSFRFVAEIGASVSRGDLSGVTMLSPHSLFRADLQGVAAQTGSSVGIDPVITRTYGKEWHDLARARWISLLPKQGMSREMSHAHPSDRIPSSVTCKSQSSRLDAAIRSSSVMVLGSVPARA